MALLLEGRGHVVKRAKALGLADASDPDVREVCLAHDPPLVVVTFDPDFRRAAVRAGVAVLFFRSRETTARERLAEHYDATIALLDAGIRLVTMRAEGPTV